jgi:hypothetical protein
MASVSVIKSLTTEEYQECVERFARFDSALGTIQRTQCLDPVESQGAVVWQFKFERVDTSIILNTFNAFCPGDTAIPEVGNVFIFRVFPRQPKKNAQSAGTIARLWQAAAFLGALLLLLLLLTNVPSEIFSIRTTMIWLLQSLDHQHANRA